MLWNCKTQKLYIQIFMKNTLRSKVGLKCGVSRQVYSVTGGKVMNYKNYYKVSLGSWKLCVIRIQSYWSSNIVDTVADLY